MKNGVIKLSFFHKIRFAFRALENRNFRLFFFGALLSLMGTWIQNLAIGWLVYKLTDSAFYLGLVGFASQIPALILTPIAGVYADRVNRLKVLIATQSLPMILAFLLAALTFSGHITVTALIVIVIINGMAIAFDTPFRHAFLLEMLGDKKLIPNAVALNSMLFNTARFIGPSIGGLLIAMFGEAVCFLINGVSFSGVIIALLLMKLLGFVKPASHKSVACVCSRYFKRRFTIAWLACWCTGSRSAFGSLVFGIAEQYQPFATYDSQCSLTFWTCANGIQLLKTELAFTCTFVYYWFWDDYQFCFDEHTFTDGSGRRSPRKGIGALQHVVFGFYSCGKFIIRNDCRIPQRSLYNFNSQFNLFDICHILCYKG